MTRPKYLSRYPCKPLPYYTLCLSEKDYLREVKELGCKEWPMPWGGPADACCQFVVDSKGNQCVLVCVGTWAERDPILVACLLVHEAVHIWQTYCDQMGEHRPATEQEAYAVQAISQELMLEFVRQTKGK